MKNAVVVGVNARRLLAAPSSSPCIGNASPSVLSALASMVVAVAIGIEIPADTAATTCGTCNAPALASIRRVVLAIAERIESPRDVARFVLLRAAAANLVMLMHCCRFVL